MIFVLLVDFGGCLRVFGCISRDKYMISSSSGISCLGRRTSSLCTAGLGGACISWSTVGHPWQQRILMSLCGADVSFVAAAKAQTRCIKSAADTWD